MPRLKIVISYVVDVPDDIYAMNPDPGCLAVTSDPTLIFYTQNDDAIGYVPHCVYVAEPFVPPVLSDELSIDEKMDQAHFDPEGVAAKLGLLDEYFAITTVEEMRKFAKEKLGLDWPC